MPTPPLPPNLAAEYLAAAPHHDQLRGIAHAFGLNQRTFSSRLESLGIKAEVKALLGTACFGGAPSEAEGATGGGTGGATPAPTPPRPAKLPPDVTDPEGRRRANADALIRDLRAENKRLRAHVLDQENVVERIVAESTQPLPRPDFRVRKRGSKKPVRDLVLPVFDCQYGQLVKPEDTPGGIGGFSPEIFEERLKLWVEKVSLLAANYAAGHRIENLIIALGGDIVEGDEIYRGQEWQLALNPAEQVIGARDLLAYAIDELMRRCAELGVMGASILCVPGNHGAVGGRKGGARPSSYSWDYMVFRLLQERLAQHPIKTFAIEPAGACYFSVRGNLFGMIHGQEVKSWGSLPWYGVTRHDAKMIRTANQIPSYVLAGHHHQPASVPVGYGEWLFSGNWVGANNLSRIVGANTPSQWCYGISEEHGVCDRFLIYLDEKRTPKAHVHRID